MSTKNLEHVLQNFNIKHEFLKMLVVYKNVNHIFQKIQSCIKKCSWHIPKMYNVYEKVVIIHYF